MAGTEMVEVALRALEIPGDAVLLAQGVEVVETTGDQFVGVGLVPDVPNDPVPVEIKGLVQRQGELNDPETWSEMTTAGGHHLEVTIAYLTGDILKLGQPEAMQLVRMRQISEMHAPCAPVHAIYGVRSFEPLGLNMGRMEG
jgi:hypothetical protein